MAVSDFLLQKEEPDAVIFRLTVYTAIRINTYYL